MAWRVGVIGSMFGGMKRGFSGEGAALAKKKVRFEGLDAEVEKEEEERELEEDEEDKAVELEEGELVYWDNEGKEEDTKLVDVNERRVHFKSGIRLTFEG